MAVLAVVGFGCGGEEPAGFPNGLANTVCVAGQADPCDCGAGVTGVSTCTPDGLAMGSCVCPSAGGVAAPPPGVMAPPPTGADVPVVPPPPGTNPPVQAPPPPAPPPPPVVEARNLRITEVAMYQAVKITLAKDGQAVEARTAPVIVGKEAFVRVFVEPLPGFSPHEVEAELTLRSAEGATPALVVRQRVAEASSDAELGSTFNFDVPAGVVAVDTHWSVELREPDPDGASGEIDADVRYPAAEDTLERLGARDAGPLRVMLVPYRYQADGSGRLPVLTEEQLDTYREYIYAYYPIVEVEFELHEPVDYNRRIGPTTGWERWLDSHCQLRLNEDPDPKVLYYGIISPTASAASYRGGTAGISFLPGPSENFGRCSVGLGFEGGLSGFVMAHELGHSLGLPHAPCGVNGGPYPYDEGKIGSWGFGLGSRTLKDPDEFHDMMSYCDPAFISDYNFQKLFERVRYLNLQFSPPLATAGPTRYVRLWQGQDGSLERLGYSEFKTPPGGEEERQDAIAWDADGARLQTPLEAYFIPTGEESSGVWLVRDVGASRVRVAGGLECEL